MGSLILKVSAHQHHHVVKMVGASICGQVDKNNSKGTITIAIICHQIIELKTCL